jgi:hypothetical protein
LINFQIPNIPDEEKTPVILQLVEIIEQISVVNLQQAEEIQVLKDEIARLKGLKPKPVIKPSTLEKVPEEDKEKDPSEKRPGSDKRSKTFELTIHNTIPIAPECIPPGSTFIEHRPYTVQGIQIAPYNVCYILECWRTPDGNYIVGKLPPEVHGHYNSELQSFILYQYFNCHVTQPLLLEQLLEWKVDISAGQINRILTEGKDTFHSEKDDILSMGLKVSAYINVDDTGARHDGKNGYCTHIGNELFAWFQSTESKSRINFLELLRAGQTDYVINEDALEYMNNQDLAKSTISLLKNHSPLHNNLSENDIREYVKRRKVSGSTRSELGRRARDTFTSLKKTCRKLGVSFWQYLLDRISKRNEIPLLSEIIHSRANAP